MTTLSEIMETVCEAKGINVVRKSVQLDLCDEAERLGHEKAERTRRTAEFQAGWFEDLERAERRMGGNPAL